jgi:hypothetical protein
MQAKFFESLTFCLWKTYICILGLRTDYNFYGILSV